MEFGLQEFLVAIVVLLLVLYYWSTSTYSHWKKLGVPGPEPTSLFGNIAPVFLRKMALVQRIDELYKEWKHEPFFGTFYAQNPVLIVDDLDLVKNILIKDFHVFPGRGKNFDESDEPLLGHLINIDGHRWKVLRTKLTPAFTSGKLKQMIDLMLECVDHLEQYLLKHVNEQEVVDCCEVAVKFAIDVIGLCAFGINMNSFTREDSEFVRFGMKEFEPTFYNMIRQMMRDFIPNFYKFIGLQTLPAEFTEFFMNSVRETVEYREKENINRHNLVDILRDMKKDQHNIDFELTEALLTSQAFVLFAASSHTSSKTISFALYELATVPETQDRLRAEILDTLKKHNGQWSYGMINEMKYLDMVLRETLRKSSPIGQLTRKAVQPYKIPGSNVTLPVGSLVKIPIYSFHHDERYFPNPDVFDPERFNGEEKRHRMTYLPFGDGPKNCIAPRFGAYESKLGIIAIIKNFRVKPLPTTEVPYKINKSCIFPTVAGRINLKFEPIISNTVQH